MRWDVDVDKDAAAEDMVAAMDAVIDKEGMGVGMVLP